MAGWKLISIDDSALWHASLELCGVYDIYHLPEYHLLTMEHEGGQPYLLFFQEEELCVAIPFVRRPIWKLKGLEEFKKFDATSVYGYPGLITNLAKMPDNDGNFISRLQQPFLEALDNLKIISFFCRQNPLIKTSWLLKDIGEVKELGNTIAIDLSQSSHDQLKMMSKGHKYDIRKARTAGVSVYEDEKFRRIDDFIAMYKDTMARLKAGNYYFFDNKYFYDLKKLLKSRVKLLFAEKDGILISASIFFFTGSIIQYHLSATPEQFIKYSGAKVILDEIRNWGTVHGFKWLHLGGGYGSSEDNIYRFKAGFSELKNRYVNIRIIVDSEAYSKVVAARKQALGNEQVNLKYFPEYRAPIIENNDSPSLDNVT